MDEVVVQARPGGRSARVKDRVFDATIELLLKNGFEGLRVEDVAALSGVHKTSIYRRWPTRRDLVAAANQDLVAKRMPIPDTGSYREDAVQSILALSEVLMDPRMNALVRAFFSLGPDSTSERSWLSDRFKMAGQVVDHAVDRRELPSDVDPQFIAELMTGPVFRRLFHHQRALKRPEVERIVDTVVAGVWEMSGQKPPTRRRTTVKAR